MTAIAPTTPWREALSKRDVASLVEMRDVHTWISILVNWGTIFASFALVAVWPNPLTVVLALFLIGARQLGCAVLMHEASHRTLLRDRRWNDLVGGWLCAYPVWSDLKPYRPYHLQHHAKTGTADDPDLGLITPFPITKASFRRKVWRDLSGQTGIKFAKASFRRTFLRAGSDPDARRAAVGAAVTNLVLFGLLTAAGHPALYLLWVGAWLTTNTLVTRIRAIAEHALTGDELEPQGRTRTVLPRWWERIFVAPNFVNYHIEHHLLMTVPHYKLAEMHRLLRERGALEGAHVDRGYGAVLRRAASKSAAIQEMDDAERPAVRTPPF